MTLVCEEMLYDEAIGAEEAYRGWEVFCEDLGQQSSYAAAIVECFIPTILCVSDWRHATTEDFDRMVPAWKNALTKVYDEQAKPVIADIFYREPDSQGVIITTVWLFPLIAVEPDDWGLLDIGCFTNDELFLGRAQSGVLGQ